MTLITNEIHMLDGFKKTLLIFAADRRLTNPDGSYAGSKRKLFPIPYLEAGIRLWAGGSLSKTRKGIFIRLAERFHHKTVLAEIA